MHCQPDWRKWVDSARQNLQRILWPPLCLVCGGAGRRPACDLCSGCEADLERLGVACVRCAQPLPVSAGPTAACGQCLRRAPRFDRSVCAFRYAPPLDQLIRALKYQRNLAAGRLLAQLFCQYAPARTSAWPDCIVPVPLATHRYRERGFNQAIELAAPIARHFDIPLRAEVVVRVRDTAEQAGLKPAARRRNVRRAFALARPLGVQRVAIVDDVMTTGSTVNEVARVLRMAGAHEIEVWTMARAGTAQPGAARNR